MDERFVRIEDQLKKHEEQICRFVPGGYKEISGNGMDMRFKEKTPGWSDDNPTV